MENTLTFLTIEEMEDSILYGLEEEITTITNQCPFEIGRMPHSKMYFEISEHVQLQQKVYNFFSEIKNAFILNLYTPKWSIELPFVAPILKALTLAADRIELRIIYLEKEVESDENKKDLTNKGLLKLTCVDKEQGDVCFSKSIRPSELAELVANMRIDNKQEAEILAFALEWYKEDNNQSIQLELFEYFKQKQSFSTSNYK